MVLCCLLGELHIGYDSVASFFQMSSLSRFWVCLVVHVCLLDTYVWDWHSYKVKSSFFVKFTLAIVMVSNIPDPTISQGPNKRSKE